MLDLHRHDEFSSFDGFGKPMDLARTAKANGLVALGTSNHGNVNGLVSHYMACKQAGIVPILGCEVYFQPVFDEKKDTYHLCLFAANVTGYGNLNKIITWANKDCFYYKPRVTLEMLKKHHEGIICTTACVGSFFGQMIKNGKSSQAAKCLALLQKYFEDDLYVEIMPYKLSEEGLQEKINDAMMDLADRYGIKCILTSDSHYGDKEDFDTYVKMHEIGKHKDFAAQYKERYMPKDGELLKRFVKMHGDRAAGLKMLDAMLEIVHKVDEDLLERLPKDNIVYDNGLDSLGTLKIEIVKGMKSKKVYDKPEYRERAKKEFNVIKKNGFADYFLIVQDYVRFAKKNGIAVGPGRGSVCNCLVAYLLGITSVDSLSLDLDFMRFLREDKKKMPDIDMDFERDRRGEVIEYLLRKYEGKSAPICSYGLYKVDNALNDLFKVCGVESKQVQNDIKSYVKSNVDAESYAFMYEDIKDSRQCRRYNELYDNIIKHFSKLYGKIRFIGTHAAGIAITGRSILRYAAVERRGGKFSCVYNLDDLEKIHVIKFDMLGLKTMSEVGECERLTNDYFCNDWLDDPVLYEHFREGDTDGVFQFERGAAKQILSSIKADCFNDIIAANAMNRPGPLSMKMPSQYAYNKEHASNVNALYYKQTKDTYGTIVYQEQITAICRDIGMFTYDESDKVTKLMKGSNMTERAIKERNENASVLRSRFIEGCKSKGISKRDATDIFGKMIVYSFNKGHATGYAVISCMMMHYKIYYPEVFWYIKLKYAKKEDIAKFRSLAVKSGSVLMLPHVNASAKYSLGTVEGESVIHEGLETISGIGEKAAMAIEDERKNNGDYKSYKDFMDRVPKRVVNCRVLNMLDESGALEFNREKYMNRVERYNMSLLGRGV